MPRHFPLHRLAHFGAIAVLLACLLAGLLAARAAQQRQHADQRQATALSLAAVKARLEGEVGAVSSALEGLATTIDALGGAWDEAAFDRLAGQALQAHPHLRAVSAASQDGVRWTFPKATAPGAPDAAPTSALPASTVAGLVPLPDGWRALVLQVPVRADAGRRDWGWLDATLPVDALLQSSSVGTTGALRLALCQPHGALVAGDEPVLAQAPVQLEVRLPGGNWRLAAVPVQGWASPSIATSAFTLAGLLAGLAGAGLLVLLGQVLRRGEQHDAALRHAAEERRSAEDRLLLAGAAFSNSSEAIILMNGRFEVTSVNPAFTEISGYEPAEVQGAVPQFLDALHAAGTNAPVIRAALEHGGRWRGEVLSLRRSGERYPTWVTINSVQTGHGEAAQYVAVCSDISVIKQTEQELDRLAHYDILTALPNRLLFRRRLVQVIGSATPECFSALLLLDIDGFKGVNDSFGHHVGDRLLCEIAARLLAGVRGRDTVARLGGDEFAVILTSLASRDRVVEAASRIIQELQAPFHIDELVVSVSVSIGIACCPDDGADEVLLTRNADAAMYAAKEGGRSTYRFYQWEMTRAVRDRMLLEQRMRDGLERGHFEVWFQPRVDIASGRLIGAEGLVRWRDPEQGLISPATFIPLAERSPLIFTLGRTVIEQVVAHAARWHAAGLPFGKLSMNVATPQIDRADLAGELREILTGVAVPRHMLEIEVTESLFMADAERARRTLNEIRALGLSIAIDDFGTGYSSLAYLKTLPINHLKIDRAFIRDLPEGVNDAAIVRAILSMSRSLGFHVTAEGIETEAQLKFLADEGCEFAQGFLFHKPMPAAEFEALLRQAGATADPVRALVPASRAASAA